MASKHRTSLNEASDLKHDFACSMCTDDKLNIEAKFFCGDCSKYFCDNCLTFHSETHKGHAMFGRKDVGQDDAIVTCDLHPQKAIELLCEDHAELCCNLCVSLDHRNCKRITLIPDAAKNIHKMGNFNQLQNNITKVIASLDRMKKSKENNQKSLMASSKSILTKIKVLRTSLNKLLDELVESTVEELNSVVVDLDDTLQKDIDQCDLLHDQLNALFATIQTKRKENVAGFYISYKKCQDKITEANSLLRKLSREPKATVTFQPDPKAEQVLSGLEILGNIQRYPETETHLQSSGQLDLQSFFTSPVTDPFGNPFKFKFW
ncbi:transcription intermediary factor 1-beta-like [Mya arenaria]|uniref:transcription intermediary factor 1-beta-like n=1 Tax=Mya arenaria TaxID=6604 RepID=UPI0022E941C9|nr:transcription intermediary factor 1-beta-like [Mya arenaria]